MNNYSTRWIASGRARRSRNGCLERPDPSSLTKASVSPCPSWPCGPQPVVLRPHIPLLVPRQVTVYSDTSSWDFRAGMAASPNPIFLLITLPWQWESPNLVPAEIEASKAWLSFPRNKTSQLAAVRIYTSIIQHFLPLSWMALAMACILVNMTCAGLLCMCMCLCVQVLTCVHSEGRGQPPLLFFGCHSPCCFEAGSLIAMGLSK